MRKLQGIGCRVRRIMIKIKFKSKIKSKVESESKIKVVSRGKIRTGIPLGY
jgi:hypothetical protein